MKTALNQWLKENVDFRGLLACGVRHADKSCFSQNGAGDFQSAALDKAWRTIAEILPALQQQRLTVTRLRWRFENGAIHCITRSDGVFLGLITTDNPGELDSVSLERIVNEFQELQE